MFGDPGTLMGVFEVSTRDDWDQRHMAARNQGKAVCMLAGWFAPTAFGLNCEQAQLSSPIPPTLTKQSCWQVVIDFGAEWCGPCRTMSPIYDALSSKFIKTMVFLRADAASVGQGLARRLPSTRK